VPAHEQLIAAALPKEVTTVSAAISIALLWSATVAGAQAAPPDRCAALLEKRLPMDATFSATAVAAGTFEAPDGTRYEVPAFCRVRGELKAAAESQVVFELWLPASGWSGRYYQLGNGGFAGNIPYAALAAELRMRNAGAATDTGHHGDGFDASWAEGHPERVVDYGFRSVRSTALAAQALLPAYYGMAARHRYFAGCSNGGRQALMAAQRYPQLWDGILAGAPAYDWTRQLATFASIQHTLRDGRGSWIDSAQLPAIERAAVASCRPPAQVVDGIARDPLACHFNPRVLSCKGRRTADCLTSRQVAALEVIQSGPRDPDGRARYFGFEPTTAAVPDNWQRWIVNPDPRANSQLTFAEQFYRHLVFGRADWTIESFDGGRDVALARESSTAGQALTGLLDATDTDLGELERHGAKLLMYFGWADAVIAPRAGIDYYRRVSRRLGGFANAQRFFRLFMAPGMTHCQGGPAPNAFGQSPVSPGLSDDARHDIRRALEGWVEGDIAPKSLVAAKYVRDDPGQGLVATQLLCPFPQHASLGRAGDPRQADNYVCVDP
jgi:Tannase and feruloyl esterase